MVIFSALFCLCLFILCQIVIKAKDGNDSLAKRCTLGLKSFVKSQSTFLLNHCHFFKIFSNFSSLNRLNLFIIKPNYFELQ